MRQVLHGVVEVFRDIRTAICAGSCSRSPRCRSNPPPSWCGARGAPRPRHHQPARQRPLLLARERRHHGAARAASGRRSRSSSTTTGPGMPVGQARGRSSSASIPTGPQTDRTVGKNSGLGLSISREIVNAYGGRIWASNRKLPPGGAASAAGRSCRAARIGACPGWPAPASPSGCRRPTRQHPRERSRLADAPELVHGTCVALGRTAALLRGPSGSGKSDLALRFLFLARRGPAALEAPILVADDQVCLIRSGARLTGQGARGHPRQDRGARRRHRRRQVA